MTRRWLMRLAAAMCLMLSASAQTSRTAPDATSYERTVVAEFPPYRPEQQVSGVIRVAGHGSARLPWMKQLLQAWEGDFQRFQPGVRLEYRMYGTSSAIPALFNGTADISILGEEIDPGAVRTFERVKGHPPFGVKLFTGSVDVRNIDYAQMFFVNKDNPLRQISLMQLDAIFGDEHRRGAPENIRTWGQLGLTGEWADKPIVTYGWRIDDSFGIFLEQYLMDGSHRWNCALHQYVHIYRDDGTIYDHGQQILDALAKDRYGIAVSNIRYAGPDVRPLALGETAAGPFYPVTKETLIRETYPLTRLIPAYIDREPGMPIDPKLKEFMRYLLSREGQAVVVNDGRYLPLSPEVAKREMRRLE